MFAYHRERGCGPSTGLDGTLHPQFLSSTTERSLPLEEGLIMAKQYSVLFVDDLDGSELGQEAETIDFSFEGRNYTIDLSSENAATFREVMSRYVESATRVSKSRGGTARKRSGQSAAASAELREIRTWARGNGYEVSDRGRIAAEIMDAYRVAQQ